MPAQKLTSPFIFFARALILSTCSCKPRFEFAAGGATSTADAFRETSGLVYVLEGKLQLDVGGMHEVLEVGDCAYMESKMAAAWSAAGKHRCRILAVRPASPRTDQEAAD